jgi:hypothetical protein
MHPRTLLRIVLTVLAGVIGVATIALYLRAYGEKSNALAGGIGTLLAYGTWRVSGLWLSRGRR